jgi:hypothetical protein
MSNHAADIAALLQCRDGFGIKAITVVAASDAIRAITGPSSFPTPKTLWLHASKRVGEEVGKLLQIKVSDVIARGWATYKELEKYTDPLEYGPDEIVTCALGEHSMDFTDRPSVAINVVGDRPQKITVTFELTLHVELKGVTLTIQAGKVTHAQVGQCELSAMLKLGELELLHRAFGDFELPAFEIPGGLPIAQSVAAGN